MKFIKPMHKNLDAAATRNDELLAALKKLVEAATYIVPAIEMKHGVYIRGKATLEAAIARAAAVLGEE